MIELGIDRLTGGGYHPIRGRRVGLYTNLNTVTGDLYPTYLTLAQARETNVVALFAPEHGIFGAAAAGEKIPYEIDRFSQLPVYSLYGDSEQPALDMLEQLDVMVCDIQHVGTRYFTYLWTLTHVMEACAAAGVPVIVCDRPNPLGDRIEGPLVDVGYESLIGRFSVPVCYGMTIGELAQMVNTEFLAQPADLTVIPCGGLTRSMTFHEQGLPWVPPSPNLPQFASVQHYPGSCLVEGTNLSEGRGTTVPFQVMGAPFINSVVFTDYMNMLELDGVRFRPCSFRPNSSKWQDQLCYGLMAHITDEATYRPLTTWLTVLHELRHVYPEFEWLPPHHDRYFFDLLAGNSRVRQQIDSAVSVADITADWQTVATDFARRRAPYLIYGE